MRMIEFNKDYAERKESKYKAIVEKMGLEKIDYNYSYELTTAEILKSGDFHNDWLDKL